jgi:hypothetical protein
MEVILTKRIDLRSLACYERDKRDSSVPHPPGYFLFYERSETILPRPEWMDTVNLSPNSYWFSEISIFSRATPVLNNCNN